MWEANRPPETPWNLLALENLKASNGATLTLEEDGAVVASGKKGKGTYTFTAKIGQTDVTDVTAIKLDALADPRLPKGGPGRSDSGNFVLTEFDVARTPLTEGDAPAPTKLALHNAKADFSQTGFDVKDAVDGKINKKGWASSPQLGVNRVATFELKEPVVAAGSTLSFTMHYNYDPEHTLGRFKVWVTSSQAPVTFGLPPTVQTILATAGNERSDEQQAELLAYFGDQDPTLAEHKKRVEEAKKKRPIDPELKRLREKLARVEKPLGADPKLKLLQRAVHLSDQQLKSRRVTAVHDVAWALINNPAFLFNH